MKRVLGATLCVGAFGWGLLALLRLWLNPEGGLYFAAMIFFGALMPCGTLLQEVSNLRKRARYARLGVKEGYVPMFCYLDGLTPEGTVGQRYEPCLALLGEDQFIFCSCKENLSRCVTADYWDGLGAELARVSLHRFLGGTVTVADAATLADAWLTDRCKDAAMNWTVGLLLGTHTTTVRFAAVISLAFGTGKRFSVAHFGAPVGAGGREALGHLVPLSPEQVTVAVERGLTSRLDVEIGPSDSEEAAIAKTVLGQFIAHALTPTT